MCFHLTDNPFHIKYKNSPATTSKKRTQQRFSKGIWQSIVPVDGDTNRIFGAALFVNILIQAEHVDSLPS